jgi:pimeloyl-ACP methyl ester carboxylesterase
VIRTVTSPDGTEIGAEVGGAGPPLVLVHGAGSGRWGFDLLRPHLEGRHTVVAVDRRGRGASGDADAYALEREFEDVAAVVRDAGPDAVLFGHSYGALCASGAAALLPGLPKLVLYEPPMGGVLADEATVERWERLIAAGDRERPVHELLRRVGGYSDEEIAAMRATPAWDARVEVIGTAPREFRAELALRHDPGRLAAVATPTLLLVGSRSPAWAVRATAALAAALPNARVRELDGHGHGAIATAPELVASELDRFLRD